MSRGFFRAIFNVTPNSDVLKCFNQIHINPIVTAPKVSQILLRTSTTTAPVKSTTTVDPKLKLITDADDLEDDDSDTDSDDEGEFFLSNEKKKLKSRCWY